MRCAAPTASRCSRRTASSCGCSAETPPELHARILRTRQHAAACASGSTSQRGRRHGRGAGATACARGSPSCSAASAPQVLVELARRPPLLAAVGASCRRRARLARAAGRPAAAASRWRERAPAAPWPDLGAACRRALAERRDALPAPPRLAALPSLLARRHGGALVRSRRSWRCGGSPGRWPAGRRGRRGSGAARPCRRCPRPGPRTSAAPRAPSTGCRTRLQPLRRRPHADAGGDQPRSADADHLAAPARRAGRGRGDPRRGCWRRSTRCSAMVEATLAFAREEASREDDARGRPRGPGREHVRRSAPISACDGSFSEPGRACPIACRPASLKRARAQPGRERGAPTAGARGCALGRTADEAA